MRIDIHAHSKYSTRPSQWILQKIGCAESFTEPLQLHQIAKDRGMSHVTISDHNTIDGVLEIAHLPDTYISEEITTYFPEDLCKVHVLALNITEAQHCDITKLREDIFDLAAYLKKENILSVVAHPLYAINDKLTASHFEQLLLLFQNFELNGARNARENECLSQVTRSLTQATIDRLAEIHRITPFHDHPWQKRLWGGSDDHSGLNIARTYTCIDGIDSPNLFAADIEDIKAKVVSRPATPRTMAHNLYSIAYQYYNSKFNLDRYSDKDLLMRFLDRNLRTDQNAHPGLMSKLYMLWQYRKDKKPQAPVSDSLLSLLRHESRQLIQADPDFFKDKKETHDFDTQEQKWYDFVNLASKRVMLHFGNNILDHFSGANLFNIFSTIGSAGGLYTLLAPFFVAYAQFAKDRVLSETIRNQFGPKPIDTNRKDFRFAHFTDTYYDVNGVALSLQQHVYYARKTQKAYAMVTCHSDHGKDEPGVVNFEPIGTYELPEYPELAIFYPPLLEMLAFCYNEQIDQIHTATPGPVGLAALAIAKILKLPISGTYHTAIPQYAQILTGDDTIEDLTWKFVLWYYDQLDVIYAPSKSTKDELIAKGIHPDKIKLYPRGIDVEMFHPAKRNGVFNKTFPLADGTKILYVGRVSKEKNLELLVDAFKTITAEIDNVQLIVVGDGPYLKEMKAALKGLPCCFTGYLKGEALAAVYASSDLFVFPSTTDTFGNVILEAQASGLPVVVSDQGGPCENILDGETGLVCRGGDVQSLYNALMTLLRNPERIRNMGQAARAYAQKRSFENAFLQLWDLYQKPIPACPPKPLISTRFAV